MKQKIATYLVIIEIISSISAILSKYLLSIDHIYGWILGAIGYILITIYNQKREMHIVAMVTVGLTFITLYGWYKWSINIHGLDNIDYTIVTLTLVFVIIIGIKQSIKKAPLWFIQTITTLFFMGGFILIGLGFIEGWYFLGFGHILIGYIYYRKKAFLYVTVQVISICIVLSKILQLPIIFWKINIKVTNFIWWLFLFIQKFFYQSVYIQIFIFNFFNLIWLKISQHIIRYILRGVTRPINSNPNSTKLFSS